MAQELTGLVSQAQKGDKKALNDLIAQCYDDLYYFAYKTVKDEDLAADITQESCITILRKLDTLKEPGAFKSWSRQIVYHQCTHHFRDAKEVQAGENEDGESFWDTLADTDTSVMPEAVAEDKAFQQIMLDLLNALPAEQRSALMLYYYEKMSVSEIASIQGISDGTVKSRLNYGRKAVKTKVEEYEKKNGIRLHSAAILPALLYFLFQLGKEETAKAGVVAVPAIVAAAGTAAGVGTAAIGIGAKIAVATGLIAVFGVIGSVIGSNIINPGPPPTNPTIIAAPTSSTSTVPTTVPTTAPTTQPTSDPTTQSTTTVPTTNSTTAPTTQNTTVSTTPTQSRMNGEKLTVFIDGNAYVYIRSADNTESLTRDKILDQFTVKTSIEGVIYLIYSVKEYPDHSCVLLVTSGRTQIYRRANVTGFPEYLDTMGFDADMTQSDLLDLAKSLEYEGMNIYAAAHGHFYDSQYGGGYSAQAKQFGFNNDYTQSKDGTRAFSTSRLYTHVPLEGLNLPYGITFEDNLATILQKLGLDLDYTNHFTSDTGISGVMILYYDETAFLTLADMTQLPDTSESNTFSFSLGYTETYEETLTGGRIATVTRSFSISFCGSEDTVGAISLLVDKEYPLNQE